MANILSRQKRLVKYLAVAEQPLTAKELAGTLEVSTKTIRNDIQQINLSLDSNKIVSKNGIGFYFKKRLDNDTELQMKNDSPNALYDLLLQLLDHKSCNFYDLADLFFVSESTLNRYIKDLNNMLIKDNSSSLPIQRKNNQIFIQGKEEDKRKIFNRFLNQEVEENKLDLGAYSDYFEKSNLKQLSKLIVTFHRKEKIEMNDFSTITFILHIAVLIERVRKGSYLNIQLSTMIDKKSSYLTTKLVEILEKTFSIELPKEEFAYIYRMYAGSVLANENLSNEYLKKAVEQMFENIYTTFYIDFTKDETIILDLQNHLSALYKRALYQQYLTNPLLEEIKSKFPFIYNVAVYGSAYLQKSLEINFPDEEIAYIALHFLSASETIRAKKEKQILFISPYGVGNQNIVKKNLQQMNTYKIEMQAADSFFDAEKDLDESIDMILTTENLPFSTSIPIYKYHSFLNEKDLENITQILSKEKVKNTILENLLKKELFFPAKDFGTPDEVIAFLSKKLYQKGYVKSNYMQKVFEREMLSSTAFGNLYALPHAINREAKRNAIAICSLEKPIQWNDKKVRLVLLLALKKERDNSFEKLFEELVAILNDESVVKKLTKQTKYENFLDLCKKASEK